MASACSVDGALRRAGAGRRGARVKQGARAGGAAAARPPRPAGLGAPAVPLQLQHARQRAVGGRAWRQVLRQRQGRRIRHHARHRWAGGGERVRRVERQAGGRRAAGGGERARSRERASGEPAPLSSTSAVSAGLSMAAAGRGTGAAAPGTRQRRRAVPPAAGAAPDGGSADAGAPGSAGAGAAARVFTLPWLMRPGSLPGPRRDPPLPPTALHA